jgi:hypothetical protein
VREPSAGPIICAKRRWARALLQVPQVTANPDSCPAAFVVAALVTGFVTHAQSRLGPARRLPCVPEPMGHPVLCLQIATRNLPAMPESATARAEAYTAPSVMSAQTSEVAVTTAVAGVRPHRIPVILRWRAWTTSVYFHRSVRVIRVATRMETVAVPPGNTFVPTVGPASSTHTAVRPVIALRRRTRVIRRPTQFVLWASAYIRLHAVRGNHVFMARARPALFHCLPRSRTQGPSHSTRPVASPGYCAAAHQLSAHPTSTYQ